MSRGGTWLVPELNPERAAMTVSSWGDVLPNGA